MTATIVTSDRTTTIVSSGSSSAVTFGAALCRAAGLDPRDVREVTRYGPFVLAEVIVRDECGLPRFEGNHLTTERRLRELPL